MLIIIYFLKLFYTPLTYNWINSGLESKILTRLEIFIFFFFGEVILLFYNLLLLYLCDIVLIYKCTIQNENWYDTVEQLYM